MGRQSLCAYAPFAGSSVQKTDRRDDLAQAFTFAAVPE